MIRNVGMQNLGFGRMLQISKENTMGRQASINSDEVQSFDVEKMTDGAYLTKINFIPRGAQTKGDELVVHEGKYSLEELTQQLNVKA
jgi:hypothetical protein